jgi:hypothetical protein
MKLTKEEQVTQSTTLWMLNALWATLIVVGVYHNNMKKHKEQLNTAKNEKVSVK